MQLRQNWLIRTPLQYPCPNLSGTRSKRTPPADTKICEREFEFRQTDITDNDINGKAHAKEARVMGSEKSLKRAFTERFKKVVHSFDVMPEVLDARHPMEYRCYVTEKAIFAATAGGKRIILVWNKVDMVPKEVPNKYLEYLRNDSSTVVFRALFQKGHGKGKAGMSTLFASSVNISQCFGSANVFSLLKTTVEAVVSKHPWPSSFYDTKHG